MKLNKIIALSILLSVVATNAFSQEVKASEKTVKVFESTITIDATVDELWNIVGDLSGCQNWIYGIIDSKVEENQRTCDLADGEKLQEAISEYSDVKHTYVYTILESPFPVKNYTGRFTVVQDGNKAKLIWNAEFEVAPEMASQIVPMFVQAYKETMLKLQSLF